MKKLKLSYLSLILGLVSFIHLLGFEKAALAIIIGILSLQEEQNKKILSWSGIILGFIYLIILGYFLIFKFDIIKSLIKINS